MVWPRNRLPRIQFKSAIFDIKQCQTNQLGVIFVIVLLSVGFVQIRVCEESFEIFGFFEIGGWGVNFSKRLAVVFEPTKYQYQLLAMKFLVFSLIVTACAASVHFRDLPVYTSGYLVTKIYPSETQCEGIPSRFFEPIGKCRADEEGSYIITKLAQSTITSYFDQTIVRYPDSSCSTTNSSIIKTLTTKLLKTCTEGDSSTGAFQFSYRAELPKEDTGILVK